MVSILANWLISAIVIFLIASYLPGFTVDSFTTALIVAFVLGIVNAFLKPIISILTLPINLITFGLFTFVINAALILLVAYVVPGFEIAGFIPALIAAVALWLIGIVINFVVFPIKT